ncbi:MAG: SOS response-associated peptidase [Ruminococcus sp.]|nr:SOS response-associated peptidase [Ruminococcus sp.]
MANARKLVIQPKGRNNAYLAGLYRFEEHRGLQVPVFSVLTRTPSESVSRLHDRMPLILGRETVKRWIRPDGNSREMSEKALTEMVVEKTG